MPEQKISPFEGINTTWSRLNGGAEIGKMVNALLESYDFRAPSESIDELVAIYKKINTLDDGDWKEIKLEAVKSIIEACSGLYLEASADSHRVVHGDSIEIKVEAINRSNIAMQLKSMKLNSGESLNASNIELEDNIRIEEYLNIAVNQDQENTSHYWLKDKGTLGMFDVKDNSKIGLPETPRSFTSTFTVDILGESIDFTKDVVYKYTDPSKGEIYRPFEITTPVFVSIAEDVLIFPNDDSKVVEVIVEAGKGNISGQVKLDSPNGWIVSPKVENYNIKTKGGIQKFKFDVKPPQNQSLGDLVPMATYNGKTYSKELVEIEYDHIPFQSVFRPESARIAKLDINTAGNKIAYIMGAGDKVPECLRYVGYQVDEIEISSAEPELLNNYDAVVLGIRALNTIENIDVYRDNLLSYVSDGGTLITQYNTSRRLKSRDFAPYPMSLGRFRVCQEEAEMRIVNQDHRVLNYPNKISSNDFENWIQERGLYFASEWADQYETIISSNDEGEDASEGGMLIAEYGDGYFVYSSFSWFRQLPAGVPGAYRIFANMIALSN